VTIQGVVDITASAYDALAGIDAVDAVVTLVGPTTYTATQTGASAGPTIGGDAYTTYAFTYIVDETTLNGTYNVVFTVTDRSGNLTVETLGIDPDQQEPGGGQRRAGRPRGRSADPQRESGLHRRSAAI
jgi:hypothetical protein